MEGADDEIGDAEGHRLSAERSRHGERHHEHRPDRGEDREPNGAFLGVEGVRQPRVRAPGPPQRAEEQQAPHEATPRRIAEEEARHLRDGEDEDEIEEEFQRRDALFALGPPIVHGLSFRSAARA
jgi:hypothetical protein